MWHVAQVAAVAPYSHNPAHRFGSVRQLSSHFVWITLCCVFFQEQPLLHALKFLCHHASFSSSEAVVDERSVLVWQSEANEERLPVDDGMPVKTTVMLPRTCEETPEAKRAARAFLQGAHKRGEVRAATCRKYRPEKDGGDGW